MKSKLKLSKYNEKIEDIGVIHLQAEWLIRDVEDEVPAISNIFRSYFDDHILSHGQQVILHIQDNLLRFTVKTTGKGLITINTKVFIHW